MSNTKEQARNWQEDLKHENGNYTCFCILCKEYFQGHKRRVVCKLCDEKEHSVEEQVVAVLENKEQHYGR